jgi:putative transposase
MPFMTAGHRKRCKRYDIDGDAHCLTFSCFRRLPLLSRRRSCLWLCESLRMGSERDFYDLWAYVIMPGHVHIVLLPLSGMKISRILTVIKQSVSKRALLWLRRNAPVYLVQLADVQPNGKRSFRFWQRGGGYDRNLRTVADIYEKIEYIHNNPVRRGLTACTRGWAWSSCLAWETGADTPIPMDRQSLPVLSQIPES